MKPGVGTGSTVTRFLDALARRDFDELETLLAPDVWFRALLPKGQHETNTARDAADLYRSWWGGAKAFEVIRTDQYTMAGREFLSYRFRVILDGAPDHWRVVEQAGFCRVKEDRIARLDVVCTGYHTVPEAVPQH
jgi:hypothetical protein